MPDETPTPPPRRGKRRIARWLLALLVLTVSYLGWCAYDASAARKEAAALGWKVKYTDPLAVIRADWTASFKKETWMDGITSVLFSEGIGFEQHAGLLRRLDPKALYPHYAGGLRNLAAVHGLSRLNLLYLYSCEDLTNVDGLKDLPALQRVYLILCADLTNVDGLKGVPTLEKVEIKNCPSLTNVDGLRGLSALQTVHLIHCPGLTNVDALKGLPALQVVKLTGCSGLTNVDALKGLPNPQWLDLSGCSGLTKESVEALRAALPNTKITGP